MAGIEAMRTYVSGQYSGSWPNRVRKMTDHQVIAIYHHMLEELDGIKQKIREQKAAENEAADGVQLSFLEESGNRMKIKGEYLNGG